MTVGIIDYGVGNLGSVFRALELIDQKAKIIQKPSALEGVSKAILPGVGNFTDCKTLLDNSGWSDSLKKNVLDCGLPMLGICVGMQLLADYGHEGSLGQEHTSGLGFISGSVESLKELGCKERVPHMGWNQVKYLKDHLLFKNIPDCSFFYFVHSYCCLTSDNALTETAHGEGFVSALEKDNILAVQFHPEKSQDVGLELYKNFLNWSI